MKIGSDVRRWGTAIGRVYCLFGAVTRDGVRVLRCVLGLAGGFLSSSDCAWE